MSIKSNNSLSSSLRLLQIEPIVYASIKPKTTIDLTPKVTTTTPVPTTGSTPVPTTGSTSVSWFDSLNSSISSVLGDIDSTKLMLIAGGAVALVLILRN